MKVFRIINSIFSSNTFIVHNDKEAIVVDVGDFEPLDCFLHDNNLVLRAVLLTHTHYDHIYGLSAIMKKYPTVPVYTSEFGIEALKKPNWNFSRYHGNDISITSPQIHALSNGLELHLATDFVIKVLATPGHDMSCLSYIIGRHLFSGDSYIPGIKVIATFPKSDKNKAHLWYDELERMSSFYDIYPGHGEIKINQTIKPI